jgi:hypothetical protein
MTLVCRAKRPRRTPGYSANHVFRLYGLVPLNKLSLLSIPKSNIEVAVAEVAVAVATAALLLFMARCFALACFLFWFLLLVLCRDFGMWLGSFGQELAAVGMAAGRYPLRGVVVHTHLKLVINNFFLSFFLNFKLIIKWPADQLLPVK